ncbi:hypothetical protein, partial [Acidiphilium multivorum]|uniref:hypothetical protein n=1 Tax=Acidiphilium multivorum TaxID=62140 RepID=UPI001B8C2C99
LPKAAGCGAKKPRAHNTWLFSLDYFQVAVQVGSDGKPRRDPGLFFRNAAAAAPFPAPRTRIRAAQTIAYPREVGRLAARELCPARHDDGTGQGDETSRNPLIELATLA